MAGNFTMPRFEQVQPGSPEDWFIRARSNLARAQTPKPEEVLWEDCCYDTQQAAEKALKSLLCFKKIAFRPVHDIGELIETLARTGVVVPAFIRNTILLTPYAVQMRYPGEYEPVTEEEFLEALGMAKRVVAWVESLIRV